MGLSTQVDISVYGKGLVIAVGCIITSLLLYFVSWSLPERYHDDDVTVIYKRTLMCISDTFILAAHLSDIRICVPSSSSLTPLSGGRWLVGTVAPLLLPSCRVNTFLSAALSNHLSRLCTGTDAAWLGCITPYVREERLLAFAVTFWMCVKRKPAPSPSSRKTVWGQSQRTAGSRAIVVLLPGCADS